MGFRRHLLVRVDIEMDRTSTRTFFSICGPIWAKRIEVLVDLVIVETLILSFLELVFFLFSNRTFRSTV